MLRRFGTAAVLLLLIGAGPASAATQNAFQVGQWRGELLLSDDTGAFQGCVISTPMRGDISYGFALFLDGHLGLLVQNANWALPEDKHYPVTLAVDGRTIGHFQARALQGNVVHIDLGSWERAPTHLLRHGHELVLTAQATGTHFSLALEDTYQALPRLHQCFLTHADTNPFDSATPQEGGEQVRKALQRTFRDLARRWTRRAGLPRPAFQPVKPGGTHLSWDNPGHYWARLSAFKHPQGRDLRQVIDRIEDRFSSTCKGHSDGSPQASPLHPMHGDPHQAVMFQGRCHRRGKTDYWQWALMYPDGKRAAFLVVILGPDRSQVEPLGRLIWRQETDAEAPPSFQWAALTI